MKALIAAACLLVSCVSVPTCVTRCGITAAATMNCGTLQRSEDRAVEHYDKFFGPGTCGKLAGWDIRVIRTPEGAPAVSWIDPWNRKVAGLTWCDPRVIELGEDDWHNSAFSHEIVHVLRCAVPEDREHLDWEAKGIYLEVESAR